MPLECTCFEIHTHTFATPTSRTCSNFEKLPHPTSTTLNNQCTHLWHRLMSILTQSCSDRHLPSVDHEIYVIFCYSSLSLTSTYSRSFMNALHCNLYIYVCAGHEALCIMHWYLPSKLVSHILVVKGSITHVT